ncbi:MAG: tRNA uridine-5-carboxymethylaminomethyl(34) synthesis GTPase MnmE, partial [Bacteroidetes bacterium]
FNKSLAALQQILFGFESGIPTDLISIDVRDALYHLGSITGEITNDELLGNIFGKFCIGK